MRALRTWALALAIALPSVAHAADVPHPGSVDPRIQTIEYDPNQVVLLRGTMGYQFMLQFENGERIQTVSIGDSLGWQITPNRQASVLFIKPILRSSTNLTVLTDKRRYTFELRVTAPSRRAPILYVARFTYPAVSHAVLVPQPEPPPVIRNTAYVVSGARENVPLRIFDDGRLTYFEWTSDTAQPAIFAVSKEGAESLVNFTVRGPFVVVDQLSPAFVLRNGKQVTKVLNKGFGSAAAVGGEQ